MTRKEALEIVKDAARCCAFWELNEGKPTNIDRPRPDEIDEALTVLDQDPPTPSVWNKGDYEAYQGRDMHVGMSPLARFGCDAYEDGYEEGKRAQAPTPSAGEMECALCDVKGGKFLHVHASCLHRKYGHIEAKSRATEREACAQIADKISEEHENDEGDYGDGLMDGAEMVARAIRSRTPKPKEQE